MLAPKPNVNDNSKSSNLQAHEPLLSLNTSEKTNEKPFDWIFVEHKRRQFAKTTKNKQVKLIGGLDYHKLQHKLCTREAGASLTNEGVPFHIEEMRRQKLVKANKTHKLRLGMHSNIM